LHANLTRAWRTQDVLHDLEAVSGADNIALRVRPTPEGMAYVARMGVTMRMAEDPHGYDDDGDDDMQQEQASDWGLVCGVFAFGG
jgi:hypothetical protein